MLEFWIGHPTDAALLLGLSTMRVAVAFLLVPLFTQDLIPALIRNALFVALALLGLLVQEVRPLALSGWQWALLYGREALLGAALGFLFAGLMWSFEMAGQLIDTKVGSSQAQVLDPLSGHQTSLSGAFLARLASWVFMPSRSLNCAMDLRARVICGFWPVIAVRSRTAPSISFESRAASPTPMLTTILVRPGTCMTFLISNSLCSAGMISSR